MQKKTRLSQIVLASGSSWRLKLLLDAGIVASSHVARINEHAIVGSGPVDTAMKRALAKARHVSEIRPEALVIGADQVVYFGDDLFNKPQNENEWFDRLCYLRGKTHLLSTAVSILRNGEEVHFVETTKVTFRKDLSDAEIRAYVNHGEARGCAGGYMMEKHGAWLIESITGDWQNVIGLPIFPLITKLKELGYNYPFDIN